MTHWLCWLALCFGGGVAATPDLATGAGCAAYGVAERGGTDQVVFVPVLTTARKVARECGSTGRGRVRGCYFPDGRAFILRNDDQAYWHEWCHAKFGPAHSRGGYTAQRLYTPRADAATLTQPVAP